jgi:beta-N-acetylhexosaminidase
VRSLLTKEGLGVNMDLRRRVGQLFMLGIPGPEVTTEDAALLREYRPGGVILFARNLENAAQIVRLTNDLQALSPDNPLLIAVDQEGGRVSRLPAGFTIFPPCAVLGRCGSADLAYRAAAVTAAELRAVGINMNMAPVLDVHTNPENPIIGDRAFSGQAAQVSELGRATLAGLQDHGVVACGKHFPGHGDTARDSHKELPVVTGSRERLSAVELAPFRDAIQHGVAAIMTAHVLYPALDADLPATLSPAILSGLLRAELGYDGLVLTDDLEMHAILDHYGIGDAAVRAVQAGADVLLICKERERAVAAMDAVHAAARDGTLTSERLEASLRRIARVKKGFLEPFSPAEAEAAARLVGHPDHRALLATILATHEGRLKAPVG